MRRFEEMVAVHVRDDDGVNRLESEVRAHPFERGVQHPLVEQSAIGEQRVTVVRENEREVHEGIRALEFEQVR